MDLQTLAAAFQVKYAISGDELQRQIVKKINTLWDYPHKLFNILDACSEANPTNAKTPHEVKAFNGWKFVREVVSLIDDLKANMNDLSPGALRESLLHLVGLLEKNRDLKFTETGRPSEEHGLEVPEGQISIQFPHVSALISEMFPMRKKHDTRLTDEYQGKARTGLARIQGLATQMLEELQDLEEMDPMRFTYRGGEEDVDQDLPQRFMPQKTRLNNAEIVSFIRNHGDEYGIRNTDEWEQAVRNDAVFVDQLASVVYALKSGKTPRNATEVKAELDDLLREYRLREEKKSNVPVEPAFEEEVGVEEKTAEKNMSAIDEMMKWVAKIEKRGQLSEPSEDPNLTDKWFNLSTEQKDSEQEKRDLREKKRDLARKTLHFIRENSDMEPLDDVDFTLAIGRAIMSAKLFNGEN